MSYEIEHIPNHAERALARLAQQFPKTGTVAKMVSLFAGRMQTLEDVGEAILTADSITGAEGAQLDVLGGVVGQRRGSNTDAEYRTRIRARILVNKSSGTGPELQAIANLLAPDATAHFTYEGPAGASLILDDADVDVGLELALMLLDAAVAGVRLYVQWTEVTPETTFTLNSNVAGQRLNEGYLAFARST